MSIKPYEKDLAEFSFVYEMYCHNEKLTKDELILFGESIEKLQRYIWDKEFRNDFYGVLLFVDQSKPINSSTPMGYYFRNYRYNAT